MSRTLLRQKIICRDYGGCKEILDYAKNSPKPDRLPLLFAEVERLPELDQLWFKRRFNLVKIGDVYDYA